MSNVVILNLVCSFATLQVWDIVEKFDTGCTPGGGSSGINVFFDAGLLFESSTASGTPYRQGDQMILVAFYNLNIFLNPFTTYNCDQHDGKFKK